MPRSQGSKTKGFVRFLYHLAEAAAPAARPGGPFQVTPAGIRTARELHQVRERIWNTIAEGRRLVTRTDPATLCAVAASAAAARRPQDRNRGRSATSSMWPGPASEDSVMPRWRDHPDVLSLWQHARRARPSRDIVVLAGPRPGRGRPPAGLRLCRPPGSAQPGVGQPLAVAGLGVAIGVSTSIFSIVNGLAFKPSGIDDSRSVMRRSEARSRRRFLGARGATPSSRSFARPPATAPVEGWLIERQRAVSRGRPATVRPSARCS